MLRTLKNGATSNVLRMKLLDSSVTSGAGLAGLTSASAGLIISTITDVEATPTAYSVAASKVETVTTLGTFAAPTATKCRFKEVDSTNHPGVYEIQFADARFAVSGAKELMVSLSGATNLAQCDFVIQLQTDDPYVAKDTVSIATILSKVNPLSNDPADASDIAALLATITGYIDTEVAAIKAKTDNIPTDPADASDIAALLAAISAFVDTEVAAIKAKTDTLPADLSGSLATITALIDTEVAAIKAKTDQLIFTKTNELDANVQSVNGVTITGAGATGNEWGP